MAKKAKPPKKPARDIVKAKNKAKASGGGSTSARAAVAGGGSTTVPPPRISQRGVTTAQPTFGEPKRTPDPTQFMTAVNDEQYYPAVDKETTNELIQSVPPPRTPQNLLMPLASAFGSAGAQKVGAIAASGQIVFHAVGDTGSTNGPKTIDEVADKMCADMQEVNAVDIPAFLFHLGDVVYNFGEDGYYYDQFFDPYRNYNAPIFSIPGNHDGEVYPGDPSGSLQAFQKVFCASGFQLLPEAHGLSRTSMTQPSVYFALDAPFVRIIGLYSNVLEDPGVISSQNGTYPRVGDAQLPFLQTQLEQIKSTGFAGAVVVAVHHPPQVVAGTHSSSPDMLKDIDACCSAAGVYPHAVLSGHSHNYQRFTRLDGGRETPFVVAGCGGHSSNPPFGKMVSPPRPPFMMGEFRCENYSADYGYLRIVVTASQMRIEYHDATTGLTSKSPSDVVTVDLASHTLIT